MRAFVLVHVMYICQPDQCLNPPPPKYLYIKKKKKNYRVFCARDITSMSPAWSVLLVQHLESLREGGEVRDFAGWSLALGMSFDYKD